ncbi:MAG: hypothetical protein AAGE94_19930 [Acidobacteriota bacterium]
MSEDQPTADQGHPDPQLEIVFATSQVDLIPVIKSLLDGAGLDYVTDGESMMNLFPSDMLGPALHRARGELRFLVPHDQVEVARALLTEHPEVPFPHEVDGGDAEE